MSRTRPVARRLSRRAALQVLYAADLGDALGEGAIETVFERVGGHFELSEGGRAFARELVFGTASRRERIDALISQHARNWRVERMAVVDRNVLRLASYELAFTDAPDRVVLDEAIEIAREFGNERSGAFVNGVLDAMARGLGSSEAGETLSASGGEG